MILNVSLDINIPVTGSTPDNDGNNVGGISVLSTLLNHIHVGFFFGVKNLDTTISSLNDLPYNFGSGIEQYVSHSANSQRLVGGKPVVVAAAYNAISDEFSQLILLFVPLSVTSAHIGPKCGLSNIEIDPGNPDCLGFTTSGIMLMFLLCIVKDRKFCSTTLVKLWCMNITVMSNILSPIGDIYDRYVDGIRIYGGLTFTRRG